MAEGVGAVQLLPRGYRRVSGAGPLDMLARAAVAALEILLHNPRIDAFLDAAITSWKWPNVTVR